MKTLQHLRMALLLVLVSLTHLAFAQSTSSPDTVCAGATGQSYKVSGLAGSTFQWIISNGTKASGGTSDSITINWSATPGVDTLKVVEINILGCPMDTVSLAVLRLAPPTVVLSGTDSICVNSATALSKLKFTFTGVAPWSVNYTENGTARSLTTSSSTYNFNSQVYTISGVKTYAVTSLSDRLGCTGTFSGNANVTVIPKTGTSAIRHY